MRTVEETVYKFSELSDKAKSYVISEHQCHCGYSWSAEAMETINALAKAFDATLADWSINWSNRHDCSCRFNVPEMDRQEIVDRLAKLGGYNPETLKGLGECKLTGVCFDEDALDGMRIALHRDGVTDLHDLLQAAVENLFKATEADYEDFYSYERFSEHSDANDCEYYASGEFYR